MARKEFDMKKGRYYRWTDEDCDNFKKGKLYPIIQVGDLFKKGGKELLLIDGLNKKRGFSMTDKDPSAYYAESGEIVNINHSVDDLLDKYRMYNDLYTMFGTHRYKRLLLEVEKRLKVVSANVGKK